MGNKYGSNIRTYTARNLVWDVTADRPVPFVMAAPAALTIPAASMLNVFYKAQFGLIPIDWNKNSHIAIKRSGLFCNFADGLVQRMDTSRISLNINVSVYTPVSVATTAVFTKGSNEVTGNNLNITGAGWVIGDTLNGIPYSVKFKPPSAGGNLYLTDYARENANLASIVRYVLKQDENENDITENFTISNIATLNTMYESEIFFQYCPVAATDRLFISCTLAIDGASSLDFFTKTIDTSFNGDVVSFDSVIEVEVTF